LFDLSTFLPKKPTDVELKVIKEMFEASVDGQPYDTERWGQYFRPAGVGAPQGSGADETAAAPAPVARTAAPAVVAEDPPFDVEEAPAAASPVVKPAGGNQKAEDILAMIRSRQKQ
jgi:hypothetical protein